MSQPAQRASAPRPPALSRRTAALLAKRDQKLRAAEQREHLSLRRGLLWLAILVLAISIARAGLDRAFVPHWWTQW